MGIIVVVVVVEVVVVDKTIHHIDPPYSCYYDYY
jgi:hypothetical protein